MNQPHTQFEYRADIDGLRGIAVLLVVLYHLRTAKCTGGYIGVDVFFVISGYLISQIILTDISKGRFSLVEFYGRRVRRIAPALIAMLFVTAVFSYLTFFPAELKSFAQSLIAAVLSASNFYFWQHSGYFGAASSSSPLLHTWSLAVEEQFYFVLPLLLLLVSRLSRTKLMILLSSVALLSLTVSVIGATMGDSAAFYLLPSRTWELLVGTLLALLPRSGPVSPLLWILGSFLGLILIVMPAFLYTDATRFPGFAALSPCVGAALIIFLGCDSFGRRSPVAHFLASPPLRLTGLISYSLYLWHWPLIVLAHANLSLDGEVANHLPKRVLTVFLLAISFVLAFLSWRFIETPFRFGGLRLSRPWMFRGAAFAGGVLMLIGVAIMSSRLPSLRWSEKATQVANYADYEHKSQWREGSCFIDFVIGSKHQRVFNTGLCLGESPTRPSYLLMGDSHAADLWSALADTFPELGIMQATASGCKPTFRTDDSVPVNLPIESKKVDFTQYTCSDMMSFVYRSWLYAHHPEGLIISAKWDAADFGDLERTLRWALQNHFKVILLGPAVEYDYPLPMLLAASIQRNEPSFPTKHISPEIWALDADLARLSQPFENAKYYSMIAPVCSGHDCLSFTPQGVPIEFDTNHFTREGSLMVAKYLKLIRAL